MSWCNLLTSRLFKSHLSYFFSHFWERFVISCPLHNLLNFYAKWNFAIMLSDKWVVLNKKVSTLLYYSFWGNESKHFFIVLTSEWFFSKLLHCKCVKINFKLCFSQLLHSSSSQQPSITGKKLRWCHDII